ncbi:unnamed protein product [Moneuplotes crassus]|uniref:Uncharacterized protein n=1 Tax=Euplotes crassus TaxID=5936 RepID=A0AAD1UK90_EUPCR|nr:unnamed protein product [Moneuplotes crassus]
MHEIYAGLVFEGFITRIKVQKELYSYYNLKRIALNKSHWFGQVQRRLKIHLCRKNCLKVSSKLGCLGFTP